jgi:hypothetical protein
MKTSHSPRTVTVMTILALSLLAVATGATGKAYQPRINSAANLQAAPALPGTAYGDAVNALFATGGR